MLNEGNQIHNFILILISVITVPVSVPLRSIIKFRFRFRNTVSNTTCYLSIDSFTDITFLLKLDRCLLYGKQTNVLYNYQKYFL